MESTVMICHWKPLLLISIFLVITSSTEGGPAEDNARNMEIPDKSDQLQIVKSNSLNNVGKEHEMFFKKTSNMTYVGSDVPVQVIYNSPVNEYYTVANNFSAVAHPMVERSKNYNPPHEEIFRNTVKRKSLENFVDGFVKLTMSDQHSGSTSDALSSSKRRIFSNKQSSRLPTGIFANSIRNENVLPISNEKGKQNPRLIYISDLDYNAYNKRKNGYLLENRQQTDVGTDEATVQIEKYFTGTPSFLIGSILIPIVYSMHSYNMMPYFPSSSGSQRLWPSPLAQYSPIVIRDPFQPILNYFSDLVEYGSMADICQSKFPGVHSFSIDKSRMSRLVRAEPYKTLREHLIEQSHVFNESPVDYNEQHHSNKQALARFTKRYFSRIKRDSSKTKTHNRLHIIDELQSNDTTFKERNEAKKDQQNIESSQKIRNMDVGPQISKLIVRRGGVAIAGAGGIATAGSGGTAIVGAGGTAFTTPASSGGVALVGPSGKVVNIPDLTNVLYGRTNVNVATTDPGHAAFTSKNREVFTASASTGGMALVSPEGGILGISDDESFENNLEAKQLMKEFHVPVGARLLTTGPIIYYNPIYTKNSSRG